MKLHEISPAPGSTFVSKRVGRGSGSTLGKTSGKGHKGQKARSGGSIRPGFEGGQMALYLRLPKRGFNNYRYATNYAEVNVEELNVFEAGTVVTPEVLREKGIIKKLYDGVKIMGRGEVEKALTVKAAKFTESAKQKIEAAGGSVEVL